MSRMMSQIKMKLKLLTLVFFGLFLNSQILIAKELSEESQELLADLKEQLQSTLLAISDIEKNKGNSLVNLYHSIDIPAQHLTNLGLVIDVESSQEGFGVLSITPGSEAEKLGIQSGDVITKINQVTIDETTSEQAINELNNMQPGQSLSLSIRGEDGERLVKTEISGIYLPSIKLEIGSAQGELSSAQQDASTGIANTCGEVSIFFRPPETKDLYSAYINSINDKGVNRMKKTFRLKPGKYLIKIHELIDSPMLTRRSRAMQRAKELEIEVKANMRYDLAAKFLRNKKFSLRDQFWEPVIWRESEQKCEL